ncbi:hypothetical protein KM043_007165 [Ampulex compressa]|nr:hypothetical protein KM043_007165 [Ampulex compressa]
MSANDLAAQVVDLRKILDTVPKYAESIITGPDIVAYRTKRQQKYLQDYFSVATAALSAITWHPELAGISLHNEKISIHSDKLDEDKTNLDKIIGRFAANKPLWIAESKREECKNQFLGALVWTRRLGNAAKLGIDVVMRQPSNLARPTPDYWVSLFHKMFVGSKVFEARLQTDDKTHAYFYCQCTKPSSLYQRGSITIFGVNFTPTNALVNPKGEKFDTLHEYILSPGFDASNRMFSETVFLNNISLSLVDDKYIPNIEPVILTNTKGVNISLPAGHIGFWVAPNLKVKSCMDDDERNVDKEEFRKSSKRSNLIGENEENDDGKANEITDNSRKGEKFLVQAGVKKQVNTENEKSRTAKKFGTRGILRRMRKFLKKRLNNSQEQQVLSVASRHEEPKRLEFYEKLAEALVLFKNRLLRNDETKDDNTKIATKSLSLITKMERTLEKLTTSKPTSTETTIATPRSKKSEQRILSIQKYLKSLQNLLSRANLEESMEAVKLKEDISEREMRRSKREVDKKVMDDALSLRKEAVLRKRSKIEELKDRRIERKPRRKEDFKKELLPAPFDPKNTESGENNFYGFFRKEPPQNFPEGDVYLATGDSAQETDYDYVKDDDAPNEKQSIIIPETTLSMKDYDNPEQTSANNNDYQEYLPYEFFEKVKMPKHRAKDDLLKSAEIWEAEFFQKNHDDRDDDDAVDPPDIKITRERVPEKDEIRDANERSMKDLAAYYGSRYTANDRKMNYEELQAALLDLVAGVANKLVSSGKNYGRDRKRTVSKDSEMRLYNGSGTEKRADDALRDSLVDAQVYDTIHGRKRSRRNINQLDLLLDQEMINEDDENLKDCQCRVIRDFMETPKPCSCRSKRNTHDQANTESIVDDVVVTKNGSVSENQEDIDINNSTLIDLVSSEKALSNVEILEITSETPDAESKVLDSFQFPLESSTSYDNYEIHIVDTNGADEERENHDPENQSIVQRHVLPVPLPTPESKLQNTAAYWQTTTEAVEESSTPIENTFETQEVLNNATSSQTTDEISRAVTVSTINVDDKSLTSSTTNSTDNPLDATTSVQKEIKFFREDVESITKEATAIRTFRNPLESDSYFGKIDSTFTTSDATQKTTNSVLEETETSNSKNSQEPPRSKSHYTTLQSTISPMENSNDRAEENDSNDQYLTRSMKRKVDSDQSSKFEDKKLTRRPVETSRSAKSSQRPADDAKLRSLQRTEDLVKVKEDRLVARLKTLLALRREDEGRDSKRSIENSQRFGRDETVRYQEHQRRREEQIRRLKEKLRMKREKLLKQYRDEVLSAVEKINDEEKRNLKRREVWERIKEGDDFRDMIDREKLAYVLTYKPVNYRTVKRDNREIVDRERTYGVPVEIVRLKNVRERVTQPRDHRYSRNTGVVRYDDSYKPLEKTIRLKIPQEKSAITRRERYSDDKHGSGKSYCAILEDLEDPWMFEYQRHAQDRRNDDARNEGKILNQESSNRKIYVIDPSTYRGGEPLLEVYDNRPKGNPGTTGIDKSKEKVKNLKYDRGMEDECGENLKAPDNRLKNINADQAFHVLNISEKYDLPETDTGDLFVSPVEKPSSQKDSNKTKFNTTGKEMIVGKKINNEPAKTTEAMIKSDIINNSTSLRNVDEEENITKKNESFNMDTIKNTTEQTTKSANISIRTNVNIMDMVTPKKIQLSSQRNSNKTDFSTTEKEMVAGKKINNGPEETTEAMIKSDIINNSTSLRNVDEEENTTKKNESFNMDTIKNTTEQTTKSANISIGTNVNIMDMVTPKTTQLSSQRNSNKTDFSTTEKEMVAGKKINNGPEETTEAMIKSHTMANSTSLRNANGEENAAKKNQSLNMNTARNITEQTTKSSNISIGSNVNIMDIVTPKTIQPSSQRDSNKTDFSTTEKEMIARKKINNGPEETTEVMIKSHTIDNSTSLRNADGEENTAKKNQSFNMDIAKNTTEQTIKGSNISGGTNLDIMDVFTPKTIQETVPQNVEHCGNLKTNVYVTKATNPRQRREIDPNLKARRIQPHDRLRKKRSSYICINTDSRETSEEKTKKLYKLVKEENHYIAVPVKNKETNRHSPIVGTGIEQYDNYEDEYKNPKYDRLASRKIKQDTYLVASNEDRTENVESAETSKEYIDILIPSKSSIPTNPLIRKSHAQKFRYEDDVVSDEMPELERSDEQLTRSFSKARLNSKYNQPTDSLEEYLDQSSSYSPEFDNLPYISNIRDNNDDNNGYVSLEDILDSNKHRILMLLPQGHRKFNRPRRHVKDHDGFGKNQETKNVSLSGQHTVTTQESPIRKYLPDINGSTIDDPERRNNPKVMRIDEKKEKLFDINSRSKSDKSFLSSNKINDLVEQTIQSEEYTENDLGQIFTKQQKIKKNEINKEDNGLSSFIEGTIPKLQNVIIGSFEKAQNISGSMEHFIEKFDEKFNKTLKTDGQDNIGQNSTFVNTTNNVFHTAILNVKKFFTFLSGITHILRG